MAQSKAHMRLPVSHW